MKITLKQLGAVGIKPHGFFFTLEIPGEEEVVLHRLHLTHGKPVSLEDVISAVFQAGKDAAHKEVRRVLGIS